MTKHKVVIMVITNLIMVFSVVANLGLKRNDRYVCNDESTGAIRKTMSTHIRWYSVISLIRVEVSRKENKQNVKPMIKVILLSSLMLLLLFSAGLINGALSVSSSAVFTWM